MTHGRRSTLSSGLLALGLVVIFGACQQEQPVQQASNTTEATPTETAQPPAQPGYNEPAHNEPAPAPSRPATSTPARPKPQPQPVAQTPSAPAPIPRVETTPVPAGTVLTLALDTVVSSKTAVVGDTFTATVVAPVVVGDVIAIPEGATVHGTVTEAVAAKRGAGNAKLTVSFDELQLASGYKTKIVGTFQEATGSQKKKNAAVIGGSAAGGALLGRILGKDTKGAVIGSIVGGGIGTAVVMGRDDGQAELPADTPFEIRLDEEVRVPRKTGGV